MPDAKILKFEDIVKVSIAGLITDRTLQRDIYYTVGCSLTAEEKESFISTLKREMRPGYEEGIRAIEERSLNPNNRGTFRIADPNHVYFFTDYTCDKDIALLRESGLIHSGFFTGRRDYSNKSKKSALTKLMKQNASFVASKFGLDEEGRLDLDNHNPTIMKIDDIQKLEAALYLNENNALNALDLMPALFKKPLYRENLKGKGRMAYSPRKNIWVDRDKN
ncbi:MAG: hypothetical protein ABIJ14_02335 [Nanoarchaeota archaeon]|nr:hypothetical protein [Nanoarchaeota archaeon]